MMSGRKIIEGAGAALAWTQGEGTARVTLPDGTHGEMTVGDVIERMADPDEPRVVALAEAWASIDGKLEPFRAESKLTEIPWDDPAFTGHYMGYVAEAKELIVRLNARGFDVVPLATEATP